MPWKVTNSMTLKREFAALAVQEDANMAELCRRYGISRATGYKWAQRFRQEGISGLAERSRRPRRSPRQSAAAVEARLVDLRLRHPAWGGRKLRRRLQDLGMQGVPATSTITGILHRHDLIGTQEGAKHKAFLRFEHPAPNDLWQMDFKGHIALEQGRCHPLTVLDDHSRYALGLAACANERADTVREQLTGVFRRYGLPWRMRMDNGSPWGDDGNNPYTVFTVWLLQLGIGVSHGRPYHPQTQGKDERFHRTLAAEVLREPLRDLAHGQERFDRWRTIYNHERPHEALGMAVPASRYQASPRPFPEVLPAIEYAPGVEVRKVQQGGRLSFRGREYRIPKALYGYPVALRPTVSDGVIELLFCHPVILHLDLRSAITTNPVNHVSAHR